ncbi:MAG: hypothetical protein NTW05_05065 [Pseudonocardiales bacterium]|nr:hypothetical protein [Pseudonocardiales bacterium]
MSQPDPITAADEPAPEPALEDAADQPQLNRAERRAKAKAAAKQAGHAGPPPDRTLHRGRGPRSHTKRI